MGVALPPQIGHEVAADEAARAADDDFLGVAHVSGEGIYPTLLSNKIVLRTVAT
jgi:hypothetical protein